MALDLEAFERIGRQLAASNRMVARKVIAPAVVADELDSADLAEVAPLLDEFDPIPVGEWVDAGNVYLHNGVLIEIVQGHTTQQGWIDALTPSLYKRHHVDGADFRPVTRAHDVYRLGQIVTFEGALWRCAIDNMSFSPAGYPAGWEQVE